MRTIIFSDTHLTKKLDQQRFNFLKKLVQSADEVIINGDFWEGLAISFDQFVNSEWKQLFPYLKNKTTYVYGNHDPKKLSDRRVSLFSKAQLEKKIIKVNGYILLIEHGDKHTPGFENIVDNQFFLSLAVRLHEKLESLGFKVVGQRFFDHFLYKNFTEDLRTYAQKKLSKKEILVSGHSHSVKYEPENNFINSGFIRHGVAQYLVIEDEKIKLVEEKY